MPGKIGEAWYELGTRDQGLRAGVQRAEDQLRSAGAAGEKAFGAPVQQAMDSTGQAGGRLGGVMGKLGGESSKFGGIFKGLAGGVLAGVGIAGFMGVSMAAEAAVGAIGHSITAASDLNETVSKTKVVFEGAAPTVLKWGENSATAFGLSKNAALGAAATYGNLFTALGLSEQKSADMSTSLVGLAGDLASFNNVDPTIALDALRSGLVGETEPLRQFGVSLNEARIQQEAVALGLIKTTKDALTPAAKAQAIYSIVMKDTAKAQGDFARTSSGLANQQRINSARMEDALAKLGGAILPLANQIIPALAGGLADVVEWVGNVVEGIGKWLEEHKVLSDALISIVKFGIAVMINGFTALATVVSNVAGIIGGVFDTVLQVIRPVVATIIGTIKNIVGIAAEIPGPWQDAAKGMRDALAGLENDVEAWGAKTTDTAQATGASITPAVAGPVAAGAPEVAAAAQAGIVDPIAAAATSAKQQAAEQARLTPGDMAKALTEQRFVVKDAIEGIADVQKTTLSRTKEIAALEGFLTGKALRNALKDARPEVRAEAEAWRTEAEDRLFALKNNVPEIARRTGRDYGTVLGEQRAFIGQRAAAAIKDADQNMSLMPGKAVVHGEKTGTSFGTGMGRRASYVESQAGILSSKGQAQLKKYIAPAVAWGESVGTSWAQGIARKKSFLQLMVETFLGPVVNFLKGSSPPRYGPLRFIDKWGENIGTTIATGLLRSRPVFASALGRFLTPPDSILASTPWLGRNGAPTGLVGGYSPIPTAVGRAIYGVPISTPPRPSPTVGSIGTLVVNLPQGLASGVTAQGVASAIADELRLTLNRI